MNFDIITNLCVCSILCFVLGQSEGGWAAAVAGRLVQVDGGVRRGAAGGRARGGGRAGRQDVVAGHVLVRRRGGRRRRRVRVVRAGVGAEAGHGQRGAVRGRAHGRLARRRAPRQRRRVVQRAHGRLATHPRSTSIRLRRRLRWKLCTCIVY